MTHQTETAELIQAAAKLDPSAWLSAEGTPARLHPDAAAALGGLLVAIAHTDDETLNKVSLVRSAALTAARVVAASSLDAACAHCGSNDHTWDDCEAYTRLAADAYARTLNTPPSAETCAAIRDRLHSGSAPAAVSAAAAPPTQAALRETVAETLATADGWTWAHGLQFKDISTPSADAYRKLANAVLALLPTAGRASVLREAADALGCMDYDTDSNDYGYDTYRDAWNGGVMDAADRLRRMADETATETPDDTLHACPGRWGGPGCRCFDDEPAAGARQDETATETPDAPHPPHDSWLVEWRADGGDWNVAYPTHDHAKALDRLARGRQDAPDWQWRIVRETTTYTVEQPAAGARQDGAES
jgi:hypothetical protein